MGWAAQYDATYASAKLGDVEGDKQAEMESGGFEIGEYLGHVDGSEGLYGLELHDERAIDEQVDPAFSNGETLVLSGSPANDPSNRSIETVQCMEQRKNRGMVLWTILQDRFSLVLAGGPD